jgi:Protein of unknown function (DUF3775)
VGTDSQTMPPLPDLSIVTEVVRLAEACEAERHARRPAEYPTYRFDDRDRSLRPTPARDELVAYLRGLPEEAVAGLYALYRLGDRPYATPDEGAERYRSSFDLAGRPIHSLHAADDLAAKGQLADGLRFGLEQFGLRLEAGPTGGSNDDLMDTTGSPAR